MARRFIGPKTAVLVIFTVSPIFFLSTLYADVGYQKSLRSEVISETINQIEQTGTDQTYRQKLESIVTKEEREEDKPWEIDTYVRWMPERKVSAQPGNVALVDTSSEYSYQFKVYDKLPVKLAFETKYVGIKNSTQVELPAHLTGYVFDFETTLPFFNIEKTYFRLGLSPSYYTDNWSVNSSAFRMPSRYMIIHESNEKFLWVLGVAVFPDFRDKVFPIAGFIYQPSDRLSINFIPVRPNVTYQLSEKLAVFLEGGVSAASGEYEVTKDDMKNVILEYDDNFIGCGVTYSPTKNIDASFAIGDTFNRKLQYRDSWGKVKIRNSLYTEFRVEIAM